MPAAFEQIHPQAAAQLLQQLEESGGVMPRQMYKIIYMAQVHPNENDVSEVALVKVTLHDFASDLVDFYKRFQENVPELYPVLFIILIAPVSPDIPEEGMMQVKLGPRAVEEV